MVKNNQGNRDTSGTVDPLDLSFNIGSRRTHDRAHRKWWPIRFSFLTLCKLRVPKAIAVVSVSSSRGAPDSEQGVYMAKCAIRSLSALRVP